MLCDGWFQIGDKINSLSARIFLFLVEAERVSSEEINFHQLPSFRKMIVSLDNRDIGTDAEMIEDGIRPRRLRMQSRVLRRETMDRIRRIPTKRGRHAALSKRTRDSNFNARLYTRFSSCAFFLKSSAS